MPKGRRCREGVGVRRSPREAFARAHTLRNPSPRARVLAFRYGQSALNLAAARLRQLAGSEWSTMRYLSSDEGPSAQKEHGLGPDQHRSVGSNVRKTLGASILQRGRGGDSMKRKLRSAASAVALKVILTGIATVAPAESAVAVFRKTLPKTCSTFVCRTTKCRGVAASRGLCFNWCGLCKRP